MPAERPLRRFLSLLVLPLALALGACASAGGGAMGAGAEGAVTVEVQNNLIPPTSLSVYAVSDTGTRRLVGVVQPSATRTLTFDPVAVSGQYYFVAEGTSGDEIRSNPITLGRGDTVRWNLSANLVTTVS